MPIASKSIYFITMKTTLIHDEASAETMRRTEDLAAACSSLNLELSMETQIPLPSNAKS